MKWFKRLLAIIGGVLLMLFLVAGIPREHNAPVRNQSVAPEESGNHDSGKKFQPGDFIFDHIADAYSWHIFSYHDFHLSIPLPVILYSREKGLNIFLSSAFHHGHECHKGFEIARGGEHEGKIIEIMPDGSEKLPALDISFTKNAFGILISILLMCWMFISVARSYQKRKGGAPRGLQNLMEPFIIFIRDEIAKTSIREEKYEQFVPFLLSIFFFIWINNMMGLLPIFPGGANVTGNITVTMVLALFTFFMTALNGNVNYWRHIFNAQGVPWWLKIPIPMMPVIEIVGMLTKPFVLMVRLFANIAAGHIITLGFFSLIFIFGQMQVDLGYAVSPLALAFTLFMTLLEFLVALIQAYVFTLLSALYFGMATEKGH